MNSGTGLVASIWAVRIVAERVDNKILGVRHGGSTGGRLVDERYEDIPKPKSNVVVAGYGRT